MSWSDIQIDLYVVNSYDYTTCKYSDVQDEMAKPPSIGSLVKIFLLYLSK